MLFAVLRLLSYIDIHDIHQHRELSQVLLLACSCNRDKPDKVFVEWTQGSVSLSGVFVLFFAVQMWFGASACYGKLNWAVLWVGLLLELDGWAWCLG
jgi:hypothetical protein